MHFSAVVHTCTDNFCYPLNDRELVINIKTGFDVVRCFVIFGDPFNGHTAENGWKWASSRTELTEKKTLAHHLWYSVTVPLDFGRCKYYFEFQSIDTAAQHNEEHAAVWYYLEDGFYTAQQLEQLGGNLSCFTFPCINQTDVFTLPNWVSKTVWYQIFPDRFCPSEYTKWAAADHTVSNDEHYGGTLRGIISKLDYLAGLGITGLYLNPVNSSPSVHKYDTSNYHTIDPAFGTAEDLTQLVQQAHRRGMKVILDGVFNHCGWEFTPWQDVLQKGEQSPYWRWFTVNSWPINIIEEKRPDGTVRLHPSGDNGKKGIFKTFAYIDSMPKLNTNNPEVIAYLLALCETWVRTYDIDGLRLDVANELSHTFCRKLRDHLRSIKHDFYLLGEIWHNAMPWLRGDELDSVMNYPLAKVLWQFFQDSSVTAHTFERTLNTVLTLYPTPVLMGLFNLLESHDTMRIATRNAENADAVWQQYALLFALPGCPCIYYGGELLLAGGEAPDNRRCMPWNDIESGRHDVSLKIMQQLIALRHTHPAMAASEYRCMYVIGNNESSRIIHLHKTAPRTLNTHAAGRTIDIIVNADSQPISLTALITDKTTIYLSHRYMDGLLEAGGFIFFETL